MNILCAVVQDSILATYALKHPALLYKVVSLSKHIFLQNKLKH
jgi:hypothetical protein